MGHPPTLTGSYDPGLVLLSYLIAAVASFTALALARRVAKSEGASQWRWLVAGAFSMGLGIWSMHFVGMLAFSMGMPHSYDLPVTALSMGVGVLASGFALFIGSRKRISPGRLAVSGLVMGLGIAAMHYTGMAAMRMAAVVRYDPALFATSVLVAVLAATAALWIAFRVSSHADHHLGYMAGAALVMGLAICGMHYTGMAAAVYTHLPGAHHAPTTEPAGQVGLALVVGAATLVILFGTLLTVFFDYKLFVQRQVEGQLTRLVDERTRELTATVRDLERAEAVLRTHAHELGEAKEHAEAMLRLKSAFLANMSHEIRTPLTAIIGFAQLLAHEVAPEQRDLVDPIEKGGRRLLETLNSVLDLSQLESGTARLDPVPLEVLAEAEEALLVLRPLADEKGLAVRLTGVPAVALADRAGLHGVLNNLVGNAVKFTEHGGVDVDVRAAGGWVQVTVSDTGVGIGPAFLPKLFHEYEQESTGHARTHEGNGLGLAITRRLLDLMGGAISVESAVGVGTTFTVTLPAVVDTGANGPPPPPALERREAALTA